MHMSTGSQEGEAASIATRQSIDAVVLDYGEVLSLPADPAIMARMASGAGVPFEGFREIYWRFREDYDRGVFDGPAYWARVSESARVSWTSEHVSALIEQDVALWTRHDRRMLAWAEGLIDRGVSVGLLSNMVPEIARHLSARLALLSRFRCVTYSCDVGSVKPEPRIYQHVLEGLGVPAGRALLVDDRPANIEGARAVGMPGIVFRGYGPLMQEIEDRFILDHPPMDIRR
jgi:putative hydrolase of the HAD superfamily